MKIAYFDLIGGASGDMVVASLLDVQSDDIHYLRQELKKINVSAYRIQFLRQKEGHIKMGRFIVHDLSSGKKSYQLKDLVRLIKESRLAAVVKKSILRVYRALYSAEKKVHRSGAAHFHQIGEIDSIVDIASSCILLDRYGIDRIIYSSVPFGMKVAPATAQLLAEKQIHFSKHPFENITPTGAAILVTLGRQLAVKPQKEFTVERIGYGKGSFHSAGYANGLRVMILNTRKIPQR